MGVARNFSKGGQAMKNFQNFQGSPLGYFFRSDVRKITKGPPLVKIFRENFDEKYGVFYTASEASQRNLALYRNFTTENIYLAQILYGLDRWIVRQGAPHGTPM